MKAGPLLAVAHTGHRRVHRQHQGLVASRGRTLGQRQGARAIALPIQLKPQRSRTRLGHRLQRRRGIGAEHRRAAHHPGGQGHGPLALRMKQLLIGHRRQQNRVLQGVTEQPATGVAAAQVTQLTRQQRPVLPDVQVGLAGQLIRRAALQVGQGIGIQALQGMPLVIASRHQVRGNHIEGR